MGNVFTENDIEILISTMNQTNLDFLFSIFPFNHFSKYNILIINQSKITNLSSEFKSVRVINSLDVGLSKSRNLAIENAVGKILIIADDDIVYLEGFSAKIIAAYNKFPEAAVVNFCAVNSDGSLMKKYSSNSKENLDIFDIFNTSSIEMSLNKEIINTVKIRFDEHFGLGGIFEMGEEAIFLFDLKRENQQLVFEPQIIVKHEELTTSDKKKINERYYIQGALFTRIFKRNYFFWLIIKLFFDLKQGKLRFGNIKTVVKSAKMGHEKFESL